MKLTIWDLFIFLFRHKIMIALTVMAAFFLSLAYVNHKQTYSSEVIIRYKDNCVSQGRALDGSEFDANEIISPKVIINANKDLPFEITDNGIRANTTITPVVDDSQTAIKEAKLKQGEEYEHHSSIYRVIYSGNHSFFESRDTLDRLIDNYFKFYNEKYIYLATVSEIDYDLNQGAFDYIEQAEIMQNNIDNAITVLQSYDQNGEYRSPTTGLTFADLIEEFSTLSEVKMPLIFSKIYTAKLSKDTPLLLDKYTERKEQNELNAKNSYEKSVLAEDRMNAYVQANVDVPNSYNSNKDEGDDDVTIIREVEDDWIEKIQEQTTYDTLIKNYVNDSIGVNNSNIDAQHCQDIINIFSSPAADWIDRGQYQQEVEQEVAQTLVKLKDLYTTAFALIDDYNSYIPQKHLECLTGIRTYKNVYTSIYVLLALCAAFVFACLAAIVYEIIKKYARYNKSMQKLAELDDEEDTDDEVDEVVSAAPIIPDVSLESISD